MGKAEDIIQAEIMDVSDEGRIEDSPEDIVKDNSVISFIFKGLVQIKAQSFHPQIKAVGDQLFFGAVGIKGKATTCFIAAAPRYTEKPLKARNIPAPSAA